MLDYRSDGDTYHVDFTSGQDAVSVSGDDAAATAEGDVALTSNPTLIENLQDYGRHKLAAEQADSDYARHRQTAHAAEAKKHIKFLKALLEAPITDREVDRWCSCCFTKADQYFRDPGGGKLASWLCGYCGAPTVPCAAKDCPNFAARPYGPISVLDYCAEHSHEIPSFQTVNAKLAEITDYAQILQWEQPNLARRKAPFTLLTAPFTAATTALAGRKMPESAATLFGSLGRELGNAAGAHLAAAVSLEDKSFDIEVLREGEGAPVLLANGFLSQTKRGWDNWQRLIDERYSKRPVFRVCWGAQELDSLKPFIAAAEARGEELKGAAAVKDALFKAGPFAGVAMATETAAKWQIAKQRATNTGLVLADLISRTDTPEYVLMGFSLGARVMVATARALAEAGATGKHARISEMHLFGGAVRQSRDLAEIVKAVRKAIWNYYSHNDSVLSIVFKTAEFGAEAIGFDGMGLDEPKIHDIDVSGVVAEHNLYLPNVTLQRL